APAAARASTAPPTRSSASPPPPTPDPSHHAQPSPVIVLSPGIIESTRANCFEPPWTVYRSTDNQPPFEQPPFERRLRRRNLPSGEASEGAVEAPSELNACVVPQILDAVGAFPGEFGLRPPEVAVRRRLLVDGASQVEVLDDAGRREVEVPP